MTKIRTFFEKHDFLVILVVMAVFIALTTPGIAWGTPDLWHPDEIIRRVILALQGEWQFDENNFDYPSLPKYVMYGLGSIMFSRGFSNQEFIIAARFVSVLLGAAVIGITFRIIKTHSGKLYPAILGALLLLTNQHLAINARWAHNDLYVTFFAILAVYWLQKYSQSDQKLWLYASFFTVGLAASSKYNAGSLLLAPALIFIINRLSKQASKQAASLLSLEVVETLFIGLVLCFAGYALGTPKVALWLAFYLKRLIPALQRHATYGRGPESRIGILGQWRVMGSLMGFPFFAWGMASILMATGGLVRDRITKLSLDFRHKSLVVILLSLLVLYLPILISYNIQERFFLPLLPLLAVISALAFERVVEICSSKSLPIVKQVLIAGLSLVLVFNFLKVVSVTLLFYHDARIAASQYIQTLPAGTRIEYTLYPPTISKEHFSACHNYPLFFIKFPGQELPHSLFYEFNVGEEGVKDRQPNFLVLDSFTYRRFDNPEVLFPASPGL